MIESELNESGSRSTSTASETSNWDRELAALRGRFPKASDGILFCVFKLLQDPELTIRDFRDEAQLYGIRIGGRAIHSAKVLLGMERPSVRRSPAKDDAPAKPANGASRTPSSNGDTKRDEDQLDKINSDVESSLISAVQQIQNAATADGRRLREAMRRAVDVLQRALDGRDLD